MNESSTVSRKDAHIDLCATQSVEASSTLFSCLRLIHCAMPELALDEVQLGTSFGGKSLSAPLLITGMTGGTEKAAQINRDLALAAEEVGVALGVGSQRAMSEVEDVAKTFRVRPWAPSVPLIGNLGLWQARKLGPDGVLRLMESIDADALALHLNVAQELTQPEGDRDFREGYSTVALLAARLGEKLWVKETGCGLSPPVARRLVSCGVRTLDVSGAGGTSWVQVERLRGRPSENDVASSFVDWGIPTAAAVASVRKAVGPSVRLIASGGVRHGLEAAKALALGADWAGTALPILRAQQEAGAEGAVKALKGFIDGLRQTLVLTGCRSVSELRQQPYVVTGELKDWLHSL